MPASYPKLTEAQRAKVVELATRDGVKQIDLASRFSVSKTTIAKILRAAAKEKA